MSSGGVTRQSSPKGGPFAAGTPLSLAPDLDPDADFVYDYETLRIAGLSIAAILVVLSILLLTGNRIRRCGKSKHKPVDEQGQILH
ncbi:sodium/potassium-transporting ATPase subunit gamma-like [Brachyhypopomus gauderio]|uniref:sodium/potassium-transporting ATPase subunit gamma-like n=1 Tax=Brachyhypopomus gauderio TaxID=698409 RepID=UPI00404334EB